MTQITSEILQNWDESSRREWLITNGIGGYASSSLSGANTRRYHGLLVPAFSPPLGRAVLFSKLEEEIRVEDQLYLLSANKYRSVVQPQGFRHLTYFGNTPVPTFTYIFHEDTVVLEKRIWMAYGKNTVYIQYHLVKAPESIRLRLIPLMAYKDYHTEQHRWDGFFGRLTHESNGRLKFLAYDEAAPLYFDLTPSFDFTDESGWFYNFEHPREMERGLDCTEDLYCPGRFDGTLSIGQTVTLVATVETDLPEEAGKVLEAESGRQMQLLKQASVDPGTDPVREELILAADQFVIPKADKVERATVIAGYPWFTDWGRDTMISLPVLCLTTHRFDVARDILSAFAKAAHNGLLPNRFTDGGGGAEYNTVDASLWFFHAVYQYGETSGDWDFTTKEMLPVLQDMIAHHVAGTDYGIHVDPADGLLAAGQPGVQLTWMDAKVGDWVVTPRIGKPVEINALWYNALCVTSEIAAKAGLKDVSASYKNQSEQVRASFIDQFWNPATHSLFDVIGPDGRPDPSMRPNQIFAVSLPFAVVQGDKAKTIVDQVGDALLTPYGLRTLAAGSPDYKAHYGPGDQATRDGAYHQGTVWPWLLGGYIEAHLKVYNDKPAALALLKSLLSDGMTKYGVGTINEIFDGDAPYAPNGCIAQAWSVSEILRVLTLVS
jgi:predicted glycogen debranching enzyme